ncbi:MAG: outer membrane beta-barrel protein, partial [Elusimicrobia bacterium]|nr:outer membrane beta-barrel protein [Elusimicrobiota bacterium]
TSPRRASATSSNALALLLLVLGAAPAGATVGYRAGDAGFGLRLGWQYPTATDGLDIAARSGPAGGFHYFRHLSEWFALGAELDAVLFRKGQEPLVGGRAPGQRLAGYTGAALGTGRVNLVFDRPWTVFVKGGAGVHRTRARVDTLSDTGIKSHHSLALLAAGGVEAMVARSLSLAFEARFLSFHLDRNKFGLESAEVLTYQFGVNFLFGRK